MTGGHYSHSKPTYTSRRAGSEYETIYVDMRLYMYILRTELCNDTPGYEIVLGSLGDQMYW